MRGLVVWRGVVVRKGGGSGLKWDLEDVLLAVDDADVRGVHLSVVCCDVVAAWRSFVFY